MPSRREVSFVLPRAQARAIVDRARQEWGSDPGDASDERHAVVRLFLGGFGAYNQYAGDRARRAVGAFHVRWRTPSPEEATIDLIEWDPSGGGSEEEVREVIDALAGERVAT